jgi:putative salt-induced outer membrane protein YdiY
MVVLMEDGSTIRDQPIVVDESGIVVTQDDGSQRAYAVHDFKILNPEPWELGEGYKAFGLVSVALQVEKGNTVTNELDFKMESTWRSLRDRYTLKLFGELDEANGIKNADNSHLTGKYDYFLEGQDYWGGKFSAKQDVFADLDLRAYIGPYYGRQYFERPIFTLSGEFGFAYVHEDFIVAENQDYPGAHWEVNLTSDYLGGDSRLYIEQGGIWNLKDTSDIVLNTTFGLAFPLLGNLEAAAEILLEYDTGAVEDVEELDQTYKFRIGYTW